MAKVPIEVEVDRDVASIKTGRNKGWAVNVHSTAEMFLRGDVTRATIVDALSLSAGYLDMKKRYRAAESARQSLEVELVLLKEKKNG